MEKRKASHTDGKCFLSSVFLVPGVWGFLHARSLGISPCNIIVLVLASSSLTARCVNLALDKDKAYAHGHGLPIITNEPACSLQISEWENLLVLRQALYAPCQAMFRLKSGYKRVKGRSHTVEKRTSMHPRK